MKGTRKPRKPQPRSLNFIPLGATGPHALIIRQGDTLKGYWLSEIPCDIGGRAFQLEKARAAGGESYTVRVEDGRAACDCPAGTYRGRCKHADAILTLLG